MPIYNLIINDGFEEIMEFRFFSSDLAEEAKAKYKAPYEGYSCYIVIDYLNLNLSSFDTYNEGSYDSI